MPWCYVEEGVEQYLQQNGKVDTKYGYCQIKDCKCGTTGLYHINFYSEKAQVGFQIDSWAWGPILGLSDWMIPRCLPTIYQNHFENPF